MRFFFDYLTPERPLYDYHGQVFYSRQAAIDFAVAIVEDLKHSLSEAWIGACVEVRDAQGQHLYSLAVSDGELQSA